MKISDFALTTSDKETVLVIEKELDRIGIEINQNDQEKSRHSLTNDPDPSTSANWWVHSDGEDTIAGGTLDEVIPLTGINQNQFDKATMLCLNYGCVWFFPYRHGDVIESDPVKAHRISDRSGCNFLVVAHDPKLAKQYANVK